MPRVRDRDQAGIRVCRNYSLRGADFRPAIPVTPHERRRRLQTPPCFAEHELPLHAFYVDRRVEKGKPACMIPKLTGGACRDEVVRKALRMRDEQTPEAAHRSRRWPRHGAPDQGSQSRRHSKPQQSRDGARDAGGRAYEHQARRPAGMLERKRRRPKAAHRVGDDWCSRQLLFVQHLFDEPRRCLEHRLRAVIKRVSQTMSRPVHCEEPILRCERGHERRPLKRITQSTVEKQNG